LAAALAGTPAARQAQAAEDPEAAVKGLVGRSRPDTLRKRVRTWEKFSRWLVWTRGRAWPESAKDLVDYLHTKTSGGCGVSFPRVFLASVGWMETRAGIPADRCLGGDALLTACVERAEVNLGANRGPALQAPRLPLVVVAALENLVVSQTVPEGIRVVAWTRLVKTYGTLRADDLKRLRPQDVSLRAAGLTGTLTQTKTSGAGRKVRSLPLFVPRVAFLIQPDWLEAGWDLWKVVGPPGRDYFLPRLGADLAHFEDTPASTHDMTVLNRAVLTYLAAPVRGASGRWGEGARPLVAEAMVDGWSGHSERATLPSLLAAMGVPKSERDPLGRWSPTGSDDYVRTYRAIVRELTARIRRAIEAGVIQEAAEEEEAIDDAKVYAARLGAHEEKLLDEGAAVLKEAADQMLRDLAPRSEPSPDSPTEEPPEDPHQEDWDKLAERITKRKVDGAGHLRPSDPRLSAAAAELQSAEAEEYQPPPAFLIAISKGVRRLHKADGCWAATALTFRDYVAHTEEEAEAMQYTVYCRRCWPHEGPAQRARGSSSGSSSTSS